MSSLKRKSPLGSYPPITSAGRSPSAPSDVKDEEDLKRRRINLGGSIYGSSSSLNYLSALGGPTSFRDPRTAVLELKALLRDKLTIGWQEAYFHVEDRNPGMDASRVLEMLKTQDRVKFNEHNQVFTYEPEITLKTSTDLRTYLRTHTRPTTGCSWKEVREVMPGPECVAMIDELEKRGDILILRSLTGKLKDAPLPPLGRTNAFGDKIDSGGPERWRTIFWDDIKERNRAGVRVEDESLIHAWADVKIAETDDVAKLLRDQDLKSSSGTTSQSTVKVVSKDAGGKKKRSYKRPMKINNVHMKALGIDFSQDYERPT